MLDDLNEIDWGRLQHAYGPADDAPDALRALISTDPEWRAEAQGYLSGAVLHQGSIYSCTPAVLPFLIRLAADPTVQERHELLEFLACVAESAAYAGDPAAADEDEEDDGCGRSPQERRELARQCVEELVRGKPLFVELLADPQVDVRLNAGTLLARLLPLGRTHPQLTGGEAARRELLHHLAERIRAEERWVVRAELLTALGEADPGAPDVQELLAAHLDAEQDPYTRMTAALALPPGTAATHHLADALVEAAVRWEEIVESARQSPDRSVWIAPYQLIRRLRAIGDEAPSAVFPPLIAALGREDPAHRRQAARFLGRLLSPGIPTSYGRAPDPSPDAEPDASVVAALRRAVACGDLSLRAWAAASLLALNYGGPEEIAVVVSAVESDDEDAATPAIDALAQLGPAGAEAVPALVRRLQELEALETSDTGAAPNLKVGMQRIMRSLASERLRIVRALGAIGPAAAPAAPLIVPLIDSPESRLSHEAINTLSRMGTAASEGVAALLDHVRTRANEWTVHALERFDGTTPGVVDALVVAMRQKRQLRGDVAQVLMEMGPNAAGAVPALLELFHEETGWKRAGLGRALLRLLPDRERLAFMDRMLVLDHDTITAALWELAEWGEAGSPAVPAVLQVLRVNEDSLRSKAAVALGEIGPGIGAEALGLLTVAAGEKTPQVSIEACRALRAAGAPRATWFPPLLLWVSRGAPHPGDDWTVIQAGIDAAGALWEAGEFPSEAAEFVLEVLENEAHSGWWGRAATAAIRPGAVWGAAEPRLREALTRIVTASPHPAVQAPAAGALWAMGIRSTRLFEALLSSLDCGDPTSSEVLERLGSLAAPALPALKRVCEGWSESSWTAHSRRCARRALNRIRGTL